MKASFKYTIIALGLVVLPSMSASAERPERNVTVDQERLARLSVADQERVCCIAERLEEITDMDRSALDRADRKALRAETRSLKAEATAYNHRAGGTVIYISGAGLLILLIIILLLT